MHNKNSTSALLKGAVTAAVIATSISVVAQTTRDSIPSSFLLTAGRAGSFELGMTVDELIAQVGREHVRFVATFPEGMFQPELEVDLPGFAKGAALVAPIRDWPCGQRRDAPPGECGAEGALQPRGRGLIQLAGRRNRDEDLKVLKRGRVYHPNADLQGTNDEFH